MTVQHGAKKQSSADLVTNMYVVCVTAENSLSSGATKVRVSRTGLAHRHRVLEEKGKNLGM